MFGYLIDIYIKGILYAFGRPYIYGVHIRYALHVNAIYFENIRLSAPLFLCIMPWNTRGVLVNAMVRVSN
jgi:hypothetical protein